MADIGRQSQIINTGSNYWTHGLIHTPGHYYNAGFTVFFAQAGAADGTDNALPSLAAGALLLTLDFLAQRQANLGNIGYNSVIG